jgi:hypothetical protein
LRSKPRVSVSAPAVFPRGSSCHTTRALSA